MTMNYIVWQDDINVNNSFVALDLRQGLCFAYTFLTRREEKRYKNRLSIR